MGLWPPLQVTKYKFGLSYGGTALAGSWAELCESEQVAVQVGAVGLLMAWREATDQLARPGDPLQCRLPAHCPLGPQLCVPSDETVACRWPIWLATRELSPVLARHGR